MYNVGDNVVYPMHGAGVIVAIEEREVLGEKQKYYIMQLPIGDMKVMIPMNAVGDLGLRQVISADEARRVYQVLQGEETAMSSNWNRRYRANMEKIKSGDVFEVAEVVRNLTIRDAEKGLSTGERKMLDTARQILISELVIAQKSTKEEVEEKIQDIFSQ
ncbi:MAG TPA: CarD family transcriptional regulator [Firmicutes bacterium]|nr:CarD family transcriptional regulator [Bacillota bacterium]HHT43057.1 CarD family transcriptional regulator [Bacillota bacterium]